MKIKSTDITLEKFLTYFCPEDFPETGKIIMENGNFMIVSALLQLNLTLLSKK